MKQTRYGLEFKRAMAALPGIAQRLVGRQAELEVMQAQVATALTGEGRVLFASGEAGVGKSRLLLELAREFKVAAPDALLLTGHCFEGNRALAYAPLLDLLRSYLSAGPDRADRLFALDASAFVSILPEFQTRWPAVEPLAGPDPQQDKHRVFRALLGLINELASEQPVLIVLEDLHWSDDTSLEFLVQLARLLPGIPALVAGSFRPEEEHTGLRRALIEIERARLGTELSLPALTIEEVDELLREIFNQSHSIRPDFLRTIYDLTEGNPFFVEESVRSLIASGDIYQAHGHWTRKDLAQIRIPRSVQDAVTRRAEQLDAAASQVLESAAVVGQRFDFALLQRLTGLGEPELLAALRALIEARLADEHSAERFSFRHALIRQSVYERLLARERRAQHGLVAEALRELHADMPEPWLAELAYHFHAAERWREAFEYARAAGDRAERLFAPNAAIEQFTRALEAAQHLEQSAPAGLLLQRGRAFETLGSFAEARRDFEAALQIARSSADSREEWQALIDLGRSWEGVDYDRAGVWFEQALELARTLDDPAILGHSLNRLGTWYVNTERVDEAQAAHLEALAIFEELGDERAIAATADFLGTVGDLGGDLVEMRARYEQAAAIFERLNDRQALASTLASMSGLSGLDVFDAVYVPVITTHDEGLRWGTRSLAIAREIEWRTGQAYALANLALLCIAMSDYAAAHAYASECCDIARQIHHLEWLSCGYGAMGLVHFNLLAFDEATEQLEQAVALARESGSLFFVHAMSSLLIDAYIERGTLESAVAVSARFSAELPMRTLGQRRLWATRANLETARGNPQRALAIVERLYETGAHRTRSEDIPYLAWRRAQAHAALGRDEDAERDFLAAREGFVARSRLDRIWRVDYELARFYRRAGRDDEASFHLASARQIVQQTAPTDLDGPRRQHFLAVAEERFSAVEKRSEERRTAARAHLTAREQDVARLLALGHSNRQIADELFIGERTVETHVGNILGKLGFTSRTQIAAWVLSASGEPAG